MDVSVQHLTFLTLVVVRGVVDTNAAHVLESHLDEAIRCCVTRPTRIMVDLSGVTYLDRDGLDCLLGANRRICAAAGHSGLFEPHNAAVVRLLHQAVFDGAAWMTPTERIGWRADPR